MTKKCQEELSLLLLVRHVLGHGAMAVALLIGITWRWPEPGSLKDLPSCSNILWIWPFVKRPRGLNNSAQFHHNYIARALYRYCHSIPKGSRLVTLTRRTCFYIGLPSLRHNSIFIQASLPGIVQCRRWKKGDSFFFIILLSFSNFVIIAEGCEWYLRISIT